MKKHLALLAVSALLLTGCGGSTEPAAEAEAPTEAAPATTEASTPEPTAQESTPEPLPEYCLEVPEATAMAITAGFKDGVTYDGRAMAVKSEDYNSAYMIAMDMTTEMSPDDVGVYVVGDIESPSSAHSADTVSALWADWPQVIDAAQGLEFSAADHGVAEAKQCLEASQKTS